MGKKVELTNVELINLVQGCNLIQSEFELIASLDFRITKIINTLQPHVKEYQDAIEKVRSKYRVEVEDDNDNNESDDEPEVKGNEEKPEQKYKIEEGKEEEFRDEVKKLDDEKVEIQLPTTIHIDDFVDEDGKQLKFKNKKLGGVTYLIDPIIEV